MRRSHRTSGFSLIWALILGILLLMMAASLVQTAGTGARSSGSLARGTLITVSEHNALSYGRRLVEANAATLARTLPPPGTDPQPLATALQEGADAWCGRNIDAPESDGAGGGRSSRLRVYFTATACGQPLPDGMTLPVAELIRDAGGAVHARVPFLIVSPTSGRPVSQSGSLVLSYGPVSAASYGLLVSGDLTLDGRVRVQGDVHTDGHLTLRNTVSVDGLLSSSNCNVAASGCTGPVEVTLGQSTVPAMAISPSPAHPAGLSGTLSLGQPGETADLTPGAQGGLALVAHSLTLGVLGNGDQSMRACSAGGTCTTYIADPSGNLYMDDLSQSPVASGFSGVVNVTPDDGPLEVKPDDAQAPSVSQPISVNVNGPVTVTGDLTYAQTSCADDVCNAGGREFLSLAATRISTTDAVARIHGTLMTTDFTNASALTIFGSLEGQPAGSAPLRIQTDTRALSGRAAPAVPVLATRWHKAEVSVNN